MSPGSERDSDGFLDGSEGIRPIHPSDERGGDAGGADGFAGVVIRAIPEAFLVHLAHHIQHTAVVLRFSLWKETKVGDFGAHKEHGGAVRAGRCTRTATDASGRVHGLVGHDFRDGNGIRIRRGTRALADESAGLHDPVVGFAVDDEVAFDREGICAKRFDRDDLAVAEFPHVELTGGAAARAVGNPVNGEGAGSADPLPAVGIKLDGLDPLFCQVLVDNIQHLEEGGLCGNIVGLVVLEFAG